MQTTNASAMCLLINVKSIYNILYIASVLVWWLVPNNNNNIRYIIDGTRAFTLRYLCEFHLFSLNSTTLTRWLNKDCTLQRFLWCIKELPVVWRRIVNPQMR